MSVYVSYFAIVLLIILTLYIVVRQRSWANILLSVISVVLASIEMFDQMAIAGYSPVKLRWYGMLGGSFLPVLFLLYSLFHSRQATFRTISMPWRLSILAGLLLPVFLFSVPAESFFYAPDISSERMLFLGSAGQLFYLFLLCYLILSMVNLEITFVSLTASERWRTKFTFFGVGAIIAVELFYWSHALLYRTIDMNLIPVRAVIISIGVLFIGYSKVFRGNDVRIQISRYMLYRSLTLLLVGLYLIFMGLVGEGFRYTGIKYSRVLTVLIGFITGIVFLVILFSEQVRRRVRVFINKHFYSLKYDYRAVWIEYTRRLSICNGIDEIEDTILQTYREIFGFSGVSLYKFDSLKKGYVYSKGVSMQKTDKVLGADSKIVRYFIEKNRVYDSRTDEYTPTDEEKEFLDAVGAELIIPLIIGYHVEAIVLLDRQIIREELTFEDYDLMRTLARQSALAIKNFHLNQEILDVKQMMAVARLSSFVIHDLKNMASSMAIMIENARDYINEPDFQNDLLNTLQRNLERMKRLITRLKSLPERARLNIKEVNLNLIVREAIEEVSLFCNKRKITLEEPSYATNIKVDPEEMKKVFHNLIINALEAIPDGEGIVRVKVYQDINGYACVKISDNGIGMSDEYIKKHLFRPFQSTKEKGLGIGLYQCKQIIDAHWGRIEVNSAPGKGTEFIISLPLVLQPDATHNSVARL